MAAILMSMGRLSLSRSPVAPPQKAAVRLAARSSASFAAGTVSLRTPAAARRATPTVVLAKLRPKIDRKPTKLKTRKAASKRYKITAGGKVMRRHAFRAHLLAHKTPKRKRFLSIEAQISSADFANVCDCLPYARIKRKFLQPKREVAAA